MYERIRKEALLSDEEIKEADRNITNEEFDAFCNADDDEAWLMDRRKIAQAQLDKLLKHKDVLLRAANQDLPEMHKGAQCMRPDETYKLAQQDMLKPDSEGKHFIKVIPKGR